MASDAKALLEKLEGVGVDIPDALLPVVTELINKVGDDEVRTMLHQATRLTYRFNKGKISRDAYQALMGAVAQTIKATAKAAIIEKRTALLAFVDKVWDVIIKKALARI